MKKLMVVFILMLGLTVASLAAGMGYVDVQKVFVNYKEAQKMQEDFAGREKKFKEKVTKKQQELEAVKDDAKKLRDLKGKIQDELEAEQEQLIELNQKLTQQLKDKIIEAVKKVSREYALDYVVDRQVVLYGGIDITDWVVESLNKRR